MTAIVGIVEDGVIYMGADSAGSNGYDMNVRRHPKIFQNGPFLMAVTGYPRMAQILQYSFAPPEHPEGMDDMEYMCSRFVEAMRETMREAGYAMKDNDQEHVDSVTLVGYRAHLYVIEPNYQISEREQNYEAIGSGEAYAKGVLFATECEAGSGDPRRRVEMALQAAETFATGVRRPFIMVEFRPTQDEKTQATQAA